MRRGHLLIASLVLVLAGSAPEVRAQGIAVKRSAVVLYGSTSNTTKPATIDYKKVRKETPEYRTIRSEGVRKGSARYDLLMAAMRQRIKRAAKAAAQAGGYDCVVRKGDVKDARGLEIADLTDEVIGELESDDGRS